MSKKKNCPHPKEYKCCCGNDGRDFEETPLDSVELMNRNNYKSLKFYKDDEDLSDIFRRR